MEIRIRTSRKFEKEILITKQDFDETVIFKDELSL